MKSLPPRPPSPTELSYTQLAKLAPRFGSTSNNGVQRVRNNGISNDNNVRFAVDNTSALPTAPRTAPPSTINVPSDGGNCSISTTGGLGVASSSGNNNYQTPMQSNTTIHSNTAPFHRPRPAPPQQYPQQQIDPMNNRSTPVEDRLTNLATKLHTMQQHQQPITDQSNNLYTTPMMNNLQSSITRNSSTSRNLHEVQQFIDTLKNMQAAVSNTVDEQSRLKKSRALNGKCWIYLLCLLDAVVYHTDFTPANLIFIQYT